MSDWVGGGTLAHWRSMTELDLQIAALRTQRSSPNLRHWLRRFRPFDRRAIRNPAERDLYWINVRRRLAESEAAALMIRAHD